MRVRNIESGRIIEVKHFIGYSEGDANKYIMDSDEVEFLPEEEKVGIDIIVCPKHGNKKYDINPPHYCMYKIGEGCKCECICPETPDLQPIEPVYFGRDKDYAVLNTQATLELLITRVNEISKLIK